MAKPQTTLLCIDADRVLRADFAAPGAGGPRVYQQTRGGGALVESVQNALALASGCGRAVFVAADDIWSQQLMLPSVAVGGLSGAELSAALAFEAEPLSGIASPNAVLGFVAPNAPRQDGFRDFALIAMETITRDAIQSAVRKAGGNLRGVCCLKSLPPKSAQGGDDEWLARCAAELARTPPGLPVIAPAPVKVSPLRYWVAGIVLEAAALALCATHWKSMERDDTAARAALLELRAPQKQYAELQKTSETTKSELKKASEEVARADALLDGAVRGVALLRARIPAILAGLSREKPADIVIRSIQSKEAQSLTIEGLSLDAALADKFAAQLETALSGAGLHVLPLGKSAQGTAANGGPWIFTLKIASQSAPQTAAHAASALNKGGKP